MVKFETKEFLGGKTECEVDCRCTEGPNTWLDVRKQNALVKKSGCQRVYQSQGQDSV